MKKKRPRQNIQSRQNKVAQQMTPHPLEQASWAAAVKSYLLTKWTLLVAVLALLVAVVGIVIPLTINQDFASRSAEKKNSVTVNDLTKTTPTQPAAISQSALKNAEEDSRTPSQEANDSSQNFASTHFKRARSLYHQRRYQLAIAECNESLRANPHNRDAQILKTKIQRTIQILAENDKSAP